MSALCPHAVIGTSAITQFNKKRKVHTYLKAFDKIETSTNAIKKFLLHPEYSASMLYGIFKSTAIKKYMMHRDKRPLFGGLSEIVTLLQVLLQGDLVYIPKPLFWKRDTGYYLSIQNELQSLHLSPTILAHVKRYLLFPIGNILDLYYSLSVILQSSIPVSEKFSLTGYCLIKFVRDIYTFTLDIVKGCIWIAVGLFKNNAVD